MRLPHFCKPLFVCRCVIICLAQNFSISNVIANQASEQSISQFYQHQLSETQTRQIATRIVAASEQFLGKPYFLGPLGEGPTGEFSQLPLYRTDAFDCLTFVETVLALTFANNPHSFKQCINRLRYKNGNISFITRNHFTDLDWNQNNEHQGFLKDITSSIRNERNQPVVKLAKVLIDKPGWYSHMPVSAIHINSLNDDQRMARLLLLKKKGQTLKRMYSTIPYIPFSAIFDNQLKPNSYLLDQIPNSAIIEIVRPNWQIKHQIGTNLNVSHLGFAVWKHGILMFREASSTQGKIVDVPLIDYLRQASTSPTIKGINIQLPLPAGELICRNL
jgi:hypothetical protein